MVYTNISQNYKYMVFGYFYREIMYLKKEYIDLTNNIDLIITFIVHIKLRSNKIFFKYQSCACKIHK